MKKVLILQNVLLHYRKALYNELSKNYNITILHSGNKSVTNSDSYKEVIVKKNKIGPFFFQRGILNRTKSGNYDVIIAMFDIRWINNIVAMFLHNSKTKFIWWGVWFTKNKIINRIRLYLAKKKVNIFYTQQTKNSFIKAGINPKNTFVAHNTVKVNNREKCYEYKQKRNILFIGSLYKGKKVDILIKAFYNIISQLDKNIRLVIIGDGEEKNNLKKQVKELKITDRVVFIGKITDDKKLISYFKETIVTANFGQAGLTILHTFGNGVPFLTQKNAITGGEIYNIINNKNGLLSDDNIDSFQKKLLKLCLNTDYARKLGKGAYEHYTKNCTIENMANGFIKAIEKTD